MAPPPRWIVVYIITPWTVDQSPPAKSHSPHDQFSGVRIFGRTWPLQPEFRCFTNHGNPFFFLSENHGHSFFHREKTISWSNRETSEPSAITSQTKEKTGRWPTPTVITWFINPILIKDNCVSAINPSYWSYVHQLSHCSGGPPCGKSMSPATFPQRPQRPATMTSVVHWKRCHPG